MEKKESKTPDDVRKAFANRSILNASRQELQEFLVANVQYRILNEANRARASEMGETMRELLVVRQSEEVARRSEELARQSHESQKTATRISRTALWIAFGAFLASVLQLFVMLARK